jgi:hypothetical protein
VWNGTSYPVILAAQQDLTYGNASGAFVLKTSYWNGSSVVTAERVRVNSLGNVGIGTTTPNSGLHINSGATRGMRVDVDSGIQAISINPNGIFGIDEPGVGNGRFIINTNGRVGIGTASPGFRLSITANSHTFNVNPHASGVDLHSTGNMAPHYQTNFTWYTGVIGSGTLRAALDSSGNLSITGTFTESSALRFKENIETLTSGLEKVTKMRGVSYNKKDTGIKEIGVIAEEINEILPDLVVKNKDGEIESVAYGRLTAILIEAIKEQQQQIEYIKSLIR